MIKLRLQRVGKRNSAAFRLVAADSRRPIKGKYIELLGSFNPHTKEANLNKDRVNYWLSVGAQPSRTVHNLLIRKKIIEADKIKIVMKAKKKEKAKGDAKEKETDKKSDQDNKKEEEKSTDTKKQESEGQKKDENKSDGTVDDKKDEKKEASATEKDKEKKEDKKTGK